jgi:hypothetical protein
MTVAPLTGSSLNLGSPVGKPGPSQKVKNKRKEIPVPLQTQTLTLPRKDQRYCLFTLCSLLRWTPF